MRNADVLQKFLGAHASPFGKETLKMKGAEVYVLRYLIQVGLVAEVGLYVIDRLGDALKVAVILSVHLSLVE